MNEDKRNITVTEIKWDVCCPTVSYREVTGTQVKACLLYTSPSPRD